VTRIVPVRFVVDGVEVSLAPTRPHLCQSCGAILFDRGPFVMPCPCATARRAPADVAPGRELCRS